MSLIDNDLSFVDVETSELKPDVDCSVHIFFAFGSSGSLPLFVSVRLLRLLISFQFYWNKFPFNLVVIWRH